MKITPNNVNRFGFNLEDVSQVVIGASVLAVPIAFSEEAWKLGETLPLMNILMIFGLSLLFSTFFAYQSVFQGNIRYRVGIFMVRIVLNYALASLVVCLVLTALNKFPIWGEPYLALRRLIVISMPASMGAIIVDGFDKE